LDRVTRASAFVGYSVGTIALDSIALNFNPFRISSFNSGWTKHFSTTKLGAG